MIVVTGGAGFIGSALVWGLNQKGMDHILVVDDLGNFDKWKNLVKRKFHIILGIEKFLFWLDDPNNGDKIECNFHMGACSSTTERDMDFLLRNNTDYTIRLFKFCKERKIPFIYASSAATYGSGEKGFSDEHAGLESLQAINPYGYSKQLADRAILSLASEANYWYGLKFFNVYGPGEYHKEDMRSLVAKAFPNVRETGSMRLFKSYKSGIADGDQKRDFIYIKDVVKIMIHIFERHKDLTSGIYNVGTGKARSFRNLGEALFQALSLKPEIHYIPMPEDIRNQYQYFTEADVSRLRNQLHYKEDMTSLEEGVRDYVQNYLMKEDPYL